MIQNQIVTFLKEFVHILKNLLRNNHKNDFSRSGAIRNQSSEISLIMAR